MKTTLELPDELMRRVKMHALQRSQKLKDAVAHSRALRVAGQFAVSACDARFLAAAQSLGGRLVTEDAKLRAAAPALTQSLGEALEA